MGILSNLFKQKTAKTEGRALRNPFAPSTAPRDTDEAADEPLPDDEGTGDPVEQEAKGPQGNISFGGSRKSMSAVSSTPQRNISHTPAPVVPPPVRQVVPVKATAIPDKQISIELEELLPQIPKQFLKTPNAKKTLTFSTYDLLPGLSQGRATVPLSRIADLAPEAFGGRPGNETVQLPLQKVVTQIGAFPGRPDQVEEQYPPLDARFTNLIVEKGVTPPAPKPQPAKIEAAQVAPLVPAEPVAKIPEAPVPPTPPEPVAPAPPEQKTEAAAPEEKPVEQKSAEPEATVAAIEEPEPEPLPAEPPPPEEKVSYSLAAIFANVPKSWVSGDLKSVDDAARLVVPFHLIEPQLVSGKVELGFEDFLQAIPEELKKYFASNAQENPAAKVQIPLNEVFQNLPGVEPLPPAPKPTPQEPEAEAVVEEPVLETVKPEETAASAPVVEQPVEPAVAAKPAEVESQEQKPQPEAVTSPAVAQEPAAEPTVIEAVKAPVPEPTPVVPQQAQPTPEAVVEPIIEKPVAPQPTAPEPAAPAPVAVEEPPPAPEPPKVEMDIPVHVPAPTIPAPVYTDTPTSPERPHVFINPPVLHLQHIAPAPPVFAQEPAPAAQAPQENVPAPVEAPVATHATALNDLLLTGGKLDLDKAVNHVAGFEGVEAAVLILKGKTRTAGKIPPHFNMKETGKKAAFLFHSLETMTENPSPAVASNVTLQHDEFSSTYFKQGAILLGILHPGRAMEGELHSKLALLTGELASLGRH